jgi:hypothetical protein
MKKIRVLIGSLTLSLALLLSVAFATSAGAQGLYCTDLAGCTGSAGCFSWAQVVGTCTIQCYDGARVYCVITGGGGGDDGGGTGPCPDPSNPDCGPFDRMPY